MIVPGGGQLPELIGLVVLGQLVSPPPAASLASLSGERNPAICTAYDR
jgi:hypothetical protein